ncbi:MAG: ElyC/SanA/YdcF family protein [Thermodesulfobacteriota bacterium]
MAAVWFVIKKLLSRLLFPVGQVLVLWLVGAVIWLRRPERRLGPVLLLAAGLLLLLYSLPAVGGLLLYGLEARNWHYADPARLQGSGVRYIVVLSGSLRDGELSKADRLGSTTLLRVMEGVRLWRGMPGSKLVLSGGSFFLDVTAGGAMAALARELGVPAGAMLVEDASWDTDDQAQRLAALLGQQPFALVTSASHLPRALVTFRAHGLKPLPAPADFYTKGRKLTLYSFLPQLGGLKASETAIYEYLGLTWLWLKDLVGAGPVPRFAPAKAK